jgi:molecular chaperone DnaK (HSP70)
MVLDRYGCTILLLTVSQTVQYISTCLQWRFCSFKKKHIHNKFRSIIFISGGTVDITVQEVLHDNKLRELHKASGRAWGGTKVDEEFLQMIVKVVGDKVMQKFKCESKSDELDLLQEFEMKKHLIQPNLTRKSCFRIPIALLNAFKEEYHEELTKSIKETYLANSMNLVKDKLMVNKDMLEKLFSTVSESIINHIQDILSNPLCRDVDTILMVGGFSDSLMIQEALKSSFSEKNVIVPEDAVMAIVKGAVLFGHNPATIVSR